MDETRRKKSEEQIRKIENKLKSKDKCEKKKETEPRREDKGLSIYTNDV